MVKARGDNRTMDLLSWQPPEPQVSFPREQIRAHTINATFARAISRALKDCSKHRSEIANAMSVYLGENVTENMLNAYASEARDNHKINMPRFMALVHATEDYRLLSLLTEGFEFAVIPKKYLPLIEQALLDDKIEELTRARKIAKRQWKGARR
jgi:hypothetical protein